MPPAQALILYACRHIPVSLIYSWPHSYGLTHVVNASRVMLRDVKLADCPILALPNPPERN
jgi:hypothetical protein